MANSIYAFKHLTGGTDDSYLDYHDGDDLVDGDMALGFAYGDFLAYSLEAENGCAANYPDIILPDTNPGDKRWVKANNTELTPQV